MNRINRRKFAEERVKEPECEIIAHHIICELDDIEDGIIYEEDECKEEIALLISLEDILEEENISIEEAIIMALVNSDELDCSEEIIEEVVKSIIYDRRKIYLDYKKYWRRELDLVSPVFEVRQLAKAEKELQEVDIAERFNGLLGKSDFRTIVRRHTAMMELELAKMEMVRLGVKLLNQTLSPCMKPFESFPLEYCEHCEFNVYDPSVGIFNLCMREE